MMLRAARDGEMRLSSRMVAGVEHLAQVKVHFTDDLRPASELHPRVSVAVPAHASLSTAHQPSPAGGVAYGFIWTKECRSSAPHPLTFARDSTPSEWNVGLPLVHSYNEIMACQGASWLPQSCTAGRFEDGGKLACSS